MVKLMANPFSSTRIAPGLNLCRQHVGPSRSYTEPRAKYTSATRANARQAHGQRRGLPAARGCCTSMERRIAECRHERHTPLSSTFDAQLADPSPLTTSTL